MYSGAGHIRVTLERNRQIIDKYLRDDLSNHKKKHIHKVRVAIKKINAICQLLQFFIPGNSACGICYERSREIFKALGKLRDLQHSNNYFRNCHLPHTSQKVYNKFYIGQKHKLSKKFYKILSHFNPSSFNKSVKKVRKLSQPMNDEEILIKARQFVREKMKKINALLILKNFKKPQKIHEIRKCLKSLKYILNSLYTFNILPRKNLAFMLNNMETVVGNSHDKFVLVRFIRKLIEKNRESQPTTIELFYRIKEKLSVENEDKLIFQNIKQVYRGSKK